MRLLNFVILCLSMLISLMACSQKIIMDKVFFEYEKKEFLFEGRNAKIIFPNKKSSRNNWIWRARFWGHEPQLDKALLERGFYLVYVDVADMFGNDVAVGIWDRFYNYCTTEYNLNSKCVLEGMSRGGLIIYNWAAVNIDKVYCIYADAPVCDIKSWPGGLYNGKGSPGAWETCLKAHGLDSVSVLEFENIPINTCIKVAEAGIPVIHVYGEADMVVPHTENTSILATNFREAGGTIKLIGKEGVGHHPHSLEDPEPILDFILHSIEK